MITVPTDLQTADPRYSVDNRSIPAETTRLLSPDLRHGSDSSERLTGIPRSFDFWNRACGIQLP